MKLRNWALRISFKSRVFYSLLNKIMNHKARKLRKRKSDPMTAVEAFVKEKDLEILELGFYRNKRTIAKVKTPAGNRYFLKMGEIEPFQGDLFQVAKAIENQLSFKVPLLSDRGEGWILTKEIEGKLLKNFYAEKPGWCVKVSKKLADDYQLVIREIEKNRTLGDLLSEGYNWLFSRLNLWSKPILEAGLIEFSLVKNLQKEFEEIIGRKGENFFGWFHGNVIGDHVIVSGNDFYLLDLAAVPRVGKGYYDFLRALDFMFLKSRDVEKMFFAIGNWMKYYLSGFNETEVRLVFALRCLGVLGWDILHGNAAYDHNRAELEKKKKFLLKFINRVW